MPTGAERWTVSRPATGCGKLVYAEAFTYVRDAIAREKQIKGWRRERKLALIDSVHPEWIELRPGGGP